MIKDKLSYIKQFLTYVSCVKKLNLIFPKDVLRVIFSYLNPIVIHNGLVHYCNSVEKIYLFKHSNHSLDCPVNIRLKYLS